MTFSINDVYVLQRHAGRADKHKADKNPHEGRLGQRPTSGPNDSETLKLWNSELTRVHDDSIKTLPHRVKARNSFYS